MRILRIRGRNLASLANEFDINLNEGPLGRAGLFAITGPTGSGKSTILDAICLALYGKVPRKSGPGKAPAGGEWDLSLDDPKNVLRRGAGEAFAEVTFQAKDAQVYIANWHVRRAHGHALGKIQNHKITVKDLNGQGLGGATNTSALKFIEERTGLTFEQFRRAILLAQGDFAAFFKAGAEERANLLEAMTGTEIYGTLSILAYEHKKEWEQRLKDLNSKLSISAPMEDSARKTLNGEKEGADASVTLQDIMRSKNQETLTWYKDFHTRQQDLLEAQRQSTTAQTASIDAAARRDDLEAAEHAWALRVTLRDAKRLKAQDAPLTQARVDAESKLKDCGVKVLAKQELLQAGQHRLKASSQGYVKAIESAIDDEGLRAKKTDTWLQTHAAIESFSILGRMDQLQGQARTWGELSALIPKTRASLDKDQARIDEGAAALPGLALEVERTDQVSNRDTQAETHARAALDKHDAKAIEAQATNLDRKKGILGELRAVKTQEELQAEVRDSSALKATEAIKARDVAQETLNSLGPDATAAKAKLQEATLALRRYESALGAQQLRAQLKPDVECVVCGSTTHPWAEPSVIETLKAEHEARVEELEQAYQELQEQGAQLRSSVSAAQELIDRETTSARSAAAKLEILAAQYDDLAKQFGDLHPMGIEATRESLDVQTRAVQVLRKALQTANERHRDASILAQSTRKAAVDTAIALQESIAKLDALRANYKLMVKDVEVHEQQRSKLIESLQQSLAPLGIETAWADHEAAKDSLEQVGQQVTLWRSKTRARSDLDASMHELDKALAAAQAEHTTLEEHARPAVTILAPDASGQALLDWWHQLRETTETTAKQSSDEHEDAQSEQAKARTQLAVAASTLETHTKATARKQVELSSDLQAAELTVDQVQRWLDVDDEWRAKEKQALTDISEAKTRTEAIVNSQSKALASFEISKPNDGHEDAVAAQESIEATLTEYKKNVSLLTARILADDEKLAACARHRAELDTVQAKAKPWLQIAELIGHSQGKTFKSYAQAMTLDILLHGANVHLRELNPRYELRASNLTELEVEVIDHDLANERRSVHHLSGGETFLTALALALSLSSLAAGRTQLGSLFIDEGLGTLDSDTLDVALSILENLQDSGRQVGLISHVQGLSERVMARVSVVPLGGGKSRIDVPKDEV